MLSQKQYIEKNNMDANPESATKTIFVLSDNDKLSRAITLSLNGCARVEVVKMFSNLSGRQQQPKIKNFDLLVLAMSSSTGEPVVALVKNSLIKYIGQIPLLIISDRSFEDDPDNQISHMNFPFRADEFIARIKDILCKEH